MKIYSEELIRDLRVRTEENRIQAEKFLQKSAAELNFRYEAKSWNALECLEHLNYYGNFYLPEIRKRIKESRFSSEEEFKSGFLGNYFAESMLPGKKSTKIKTFKKQDPLGKALDKKVLVVFIAQQEEMLTLLENARKVSLTRTKTAISISEWIKLRLGDTFRVVIYHNQRHIQQANEVIKKFNARMHEA